MAREGDERRVLILVAFGLLFWFCRMAPFAGWDDAFYVGQLTSLAGRHDLLLHDDLLGFANSPAMKLEGLLHVTPGGALRNDFSIGPALVHGFWAWPFAAAAGSGHGLYPLRVALALGSVVALVLLALTSSRLAREAGAPVRLSFIAAGLAVATGPLALFATREYLGSHLLAALWYSVFLVALVRWLRFHRGLDAAFVGLAAGLLAVTRWQDVVLPALFIPALAADCVRRLRGPAGGSAALQGPAAMAAWCLLPLASQLLAWKKQFGAFVLVPQGGGFLDWSRPHLAGLLLSPFHGLVPWAPGFAIGLVAGAFLWRPDVPVRGLFRGGVAGGIVLSIYVSACASDWWAGASFGPRRLATLAPIVAVGWSHLLARWPRPWRAVAIVVLLGWTWFAATAHYSGVDDLRLLLPGAPQTSDAFPSGDHAPERWIDRPGSVPLLLRPGFTLSDSPTNRDRVIGAMAVAACLGAGLALWALARRPKGRIALLAVAGAWLGCAAGWLMSTSDNAPVNAAWQALVSCRGSEEDWRRLPASIQPAGRVVIAAQRQAGLRAGDGPASGATDPLPFGPEGALTEDTRRLLTGLCAHPAP